MVTLLKANQSLRITSEFEMDVIGTVNDKTRFREKRISKCNTELPAIATFLACFPFSSWSSQRYLDALSSLARFSVDGRNALLSEN